MANENLTCKYIEQTPWKKCYTISVNVHCAGVSFSVMVCVYLSWVVFIGTIVTAVANFILVKVELARIE